MPAKRESRRAGSTRGTAIAIDLDDSDSEGQTSTAQSTGRPARPSRTKAAPPRGPASSSKSRKGHSVGVKAPRDLSSDSDEFSDAIVVATSRTVKGKQAATTGRNGQTTASTRKHMDQQEHSKRSRSASSSIQAITKPQATSSIDRLPTPESLVTEESEPEPKRLLKADRTPVRRTAAQHEDNKSRSANTGGPSFLERLKSNATPQFSKSFKGKVRSSASGSIPLNDERFASEESDEDYESGDNPSIRKTTTKKKARKPKVTSPDASAATDSEELHRSQKVPQRLHLETIEDSSDEDLPSLPGTGGTAIPAASSSQPKRFKDSLEELNKRRRLSDKKSRSKEKQARRVVASPSPSPEPVVVVASRPASTNASPSAHGISRKKRINVRATSSSGKPPKRSVPMFRAPSDDSDAEAVDSVSEQSDAVKGQDTSKSSKSTHKGKKRRVPSSSSSSSSSSASSAPPSEEEMSEVEEDISLDFNPLVRDKLRPKDNSKAHRLDKLKQARAAKEMRAQKRRKGIIDSDDDGAGPTAQLQEESEDDEASTTTDEENFIVEDNGDIDEEELARAERLMPTQFSKHGALTLEQHFYIFVTSVVFRYFLPKSKHYRDSPEFKYSQSQLQNAIVGLINGSISSSIWREDLRAALDARPELEMNKIPKLEGCEGCNKLDRTASERAMLTGKPYNPDTFEEDSDEEEEPEQEFDLGRFCAEKAYFHHSLRHYLKKASDTIRHECRMTSTLGDKLMGDKDERKEQREKEADRIVRNLSKGSAPLQSRLWIDLDQLMERAKHKFLK